MVKQKYADVTSVKINNGFWKYRRDMNAGMIYNVIKKINEDIVRLDTDCCKTPADKTVFWLDDLEKWIESAAYVIQSSGRDEADELITLCDRIVKCIGNIQDSDGYYNRHAATANHSGRWTDRNSHELYLAGTLIEAGAAYYESTGNGKLLDCAAKFADLIEKVFVKDGSAAYVTDSHPEIELALVRLYRITGEKRYLELGKFFVDKRGANDKDKPVYNWVNGRYDQTHLPVREQTTAEGYAAGALRLFGGMADLAYEYEDEAFLNSCMKLFDNINEKRMYITGGIGSTHMCAGFTFDYDLPNLTAFCGTDANCALMSFAKRMLLMVTDAKYGDVFERVLYNSFLSCLSLNGDAFFYENPLEIDPRLTDREVFILKQHRHHMPDTQRTGLLSGRNRGLADVAKIMASLGKYIYSYDNDTVYVHQFIESDCSIPMEGKDLSVHQRTNYPVDGEVRIHLSGNNLRILAVRIPGWCRNWTAKTDGRPAVYTMRNGYAYFHMPFKELIISFDITSFAVEAHPSVQNNAGRIAIQRGPVVYCLEAIDNGDKLRDIHIDLSKPITVEKNQTFKFPVLRASGWRRDHDKFTALYQEYSDTRKEQELYFIPYYAFANRGETEMIVWINP